MTIKPMKQFNAEELSLLLNVLGNSCMRSAKYTYNQLKENKTIDASKH